MSTAPGWVIAERRDRGLCETCGQAPAATEWAGTGQLICWPCCEKKQAAFIPAPPDLGAVLASPVAYAEWALSFPAPASAPRVRRPGRIRRKVATLAAVAVAAARALAGRGNGVHAAQRAVWGATAGGARK